MSRPRKCAHCGDAAAETWDLRPCARGVTRRYDLCTPCDVALNELVLRFVNAPDTDRLMAEYRARKLEDA